MPARIPEDASNIEGATCNDPLTANGFEEESKVVISGISCRLPESENVEEFRQHLMNRDDMVTDDDRRWPQGI